MMMKLECCCASSVDSARSEGSEGGPWAQFAVPHRRLQLAYDGGRRSHARRHRLRAGRTAPAGGELLLLRGTARRRDVVTDPARCTLHEHEAGPAPHPHRPPRRAIRKWCPLEHAVPRRTPHLTTPRSHAVFSCSTMHGTHPRAYTTAQHAYTHARMHACTHALARRRTRTTTFTTPGRRDDSRWPNHSRSPFMPDVQAAP